MISTFPNTAEGEKEAFAVPEPRQIEWALEFGKAFWRVRTGEDMQPEPEASE